MGTGRTDYHERKMCAILSDQLVPLVRQAEGKVSGVDRDQDWGCDAYLAIPIPFPTMFPRGLNVDVLVREA